MNWSAPCPTPPSYPYILPVNRHVMMFIRSAHRPGQFLKKTLTPVPNVQFTDKDISRVILAYHIFHFISSEKDMQISLPTTIHPHSPARMTSFPPLLPKRSGDSAAEVSNQWNKGLLRSGRKNATQACTHCREKKAKVWRWL